MNSISNFVEKSELWDLLEEVADKLHNKGIMNAIPNLAFENLK